MADETDIYPALDHIAIVKSDATTYDNPRLRGLYVGTTGDVVVKTPPDLGNGDLQERAGGHDPADQRLPGARCDDGGRHCWADLMRLLAHRHLAADGWPRRAAAAGRAVFERRVVS